jgi:hypothetical protein
MRGSDEEGQERHGEESDQSGGLHGGLICERDGYQIKARINESVSDVSQIQYRTSQQPIENKT